jgi:Polysaccharide lyase
MSKVDRGAAMLGALFLAAACEPSLVLGDLEVAASESTTCSGGEGGGPTRTGNGVYNEEPVPAPWSTSFEGGFCDYNDGAGFCYASDNSSFSVVQAPVRTGSFAAAFEVRPSATSDIRQTRCVREGELPRAAYYSAWYYLPSDFSGAESWNLFHFRGGQVGGRLSGQWDVSMSESVDGVLTAYVQDHLTNSIYEQSDPLPIPRETWFELEFFLKRASDTTGELALYQDGTEIVRRVGIVTNDSPFAQWYVGNWTSTIFSPAPTTLYVDDVAIRLP